MGTSLRTIVHEERSTNDPDAVMLRRSAQRILVCSAKRIFGVLRKAHIGVLREAHIGVLRTGIGQPGERVL